MIILGSSSRTPGIIRPEKFCLNYFCRQVISALLRSRFEGFSLLVNYNYMGFVNLILSLSRLENTFYCPLTSEFANIRMTKRKLETWLGIAGGGSSASKERVETLEQANQELERLCKVVQRLHHDLADAQQEAEVCIRIVSWLRGLMGTFFSLGPALQNSLNHYSVSFSSYYYF